MLRSAQGFEWSLPRREIAETILAEWADAKRLEKSNSMVLSPSYLIRMIFA